MLGNEFLLGNVCDVFDDNGNLKDGGMINCLSNLLIKFFKWVNVLKVLKGLELVDVYKNEDLIVFGKIDIIIEGVKFGDLDWIEKVVKLINVVFGKDYVKFDVGILIVD